MSKPLLAFSCALDTYSGYGGRARDVLKALIELDKYNIQILSQRWGRVRMGYLKDHNETELMSRIIGKLEKQPDIWIQHTVPNEFQRIGKYNIGITAGIETTLADATWVEGMNRMNLVLLSTQHGIDSFKRSVYTVTNNKTGQNSVLKVETEMKPLFEGADLTKYFPLKEKSESNLWKTLDSIPESWCFLTAGHWMRGATGEDRKNLGFTVKAFLETFKNRKNPPALIMKTQCVNSSIIDQEEILKRIDDLRKTVKGKLPNIYLLHGDLIDKEVNELYNHPKVKAFVSLTKGEGFGRPFLEFSLSNKPIIASQWSGQLDFLDEEFVRYVKGELTPVHPSAIVEKTLIKESHWFSPDPMDTGNAFLDVHGNYKEWKEKAKRQGYKSRTQFSFEKMKEELDRILTEKVPEFAEEVSLKLPKLKKLS